MNNHLKIDKCETLRENSDIDTRNSRSSEINTKQKKRSEKLKDNLKQSDFPGK